MTTHYEVLDVPLNADRRTITDAAAELRTRIQTHENLGLAWQGPSLSEVDNAEATLTDPVARRRYDRAHAGAVELYGLRRKALDAAERLSAAGADDAAYDLAERARTAWREAAADWQRQGGDPGEMLPPLPRRPRKARSDDAPRVAEPVVAASSFGFAGTGRIHHPSPPPPQKTEPEHHVDASVAPPEPPQRDDQANGSRRARGLLVGAAVGLISGVAAVAGATREASDTLASSVPGAGRLTTGWHAVWETHPPVTAVVVGAVVVAASAAVLALVGWLVERHSGGTASTARLAAVTGAPAAVVLMLAAVYKMLVILLLLAVVVPGAIWIGWTLLASSGPPPSRTDR